MFGRGDCKAPWPFEPRLHQRRLLCSSISAVTIWKLNPWAELGAGGAGGGAEHDPGAGEGAENQGEGGRMQEGAWVK